MSSNALGVTTITYDGTSDRPATITQPNGIITILGYSSVADGSRCTSLVETNAAGLIMSFGYAYDVLGRITQMTETRTNSTNVWTYEYDLAGRLTAATKGDGNGTVLHRYLYTYDRAGNRLSEQIDTAVATEDPNVNNQVTSHLGGGVVRIGGYISETGVVAVNGVPARMLTTTNFVGAVSASVGTNYFPVVATDVKGNATTNWYQLTVTANGMDTAFDYDAAGNQLSRSNSAGIMNFGWDGADRCIAITNGNNRTVITYDGMDRWTHVVEYGDPVWGLVPWTGLTNAVLTNGNVFKSGGTSGNWDAFAGTTASCTNNGGVECETQVGDSTSRTILSLTRSGYQTLATIEYSILIAGDTGTFCARESNALKTGNIAFQPGDTFQILVVDGVVGYFHNDTLFYTSATSATGKALLPFLALAKAPGGYNIRMLTPKQADRRFVWAGTTLVEERDWTGSNVVQRFFPNGFQRDGTNYFYVKDHLGSIRAVYDQDGVCQAQFDYDPYGRRTQTFGTLSVDYGFAGLFEHTSGMKLAVWRLYDPTTGRWLSRDPIREEGGLNLYAYCEGDPVNYVDLTGLAGKTLFQGLFELWVGFSNAGKPVLGGRPIGLHPINAWNVAFGTDAQYAVGLANQAVTVINRKRACNSQPPLTNGEADDIRNAVRHAAWQARLTMQYGVTSANNIGIAHENEGNGPGTTKDSFADLYNNRIGQLIGRSAHRNDDILAGIVRFLNDGTLLIHRNTDQRIPSGLPFD